MIELKGKYCTDCKVYADTIEDEALSQIYDIINNEPNPNPAIDVII